MATTGRSRAAARAAERNVRRPRIRRISSRMGPTPASRDRKSSVCPNPAPALPPMPTIWLNPTPFGSAQSSTARHRAADCDTSATRPGRGGRCDRVAFNCNPGAAMPNDPGPSTCTPVAAEAAAMSGASPSATAAKMPRLASAASAGPTGSPSLVRMARSAAANAAGSGPTLDAAREPAVAQIGQHLPREPPSCPARPRTPGGRAFQPRSGRERGGGAACGRDRPSGTPRKRTIEGVSKVRAPP